MADENYFAKRRRERQAAQGRQQLTPPSPTLGFEVEQKRNQAAASRVDPAQAAADLRATNLSNDLKAAEIRAEAQKRAEAEQKAEAARLAKEAADAAKDKNVYKLGRAIQQLDAIQNDASDNGGWFETGKSGSLSRKFLGDGSAGYDLGKKVQGVRGFNFVDAIRDMKSQSATGSTGAGGLTETEGKKLEDAVAVLDPNMSHDEFLAQIGSARDFYLDSYRRLGGDDPQIDPSLAKPPEQMDRSSRLSGPSAPDKVQASTGYRDEVDPIAKAAASRVGKMLASGAPDGQILKFLQDSGIDPATTSVNNALRYRQSPEFKAWQRKNPGKAYPVGSDFYTKRVPLTQTQSLMNSAAQNPVGAYFSSAANAFTGNHLDDIARATGGDPEAVNTGLALSQTINPGASFAGDVSGQAMFEATAGRLPGLRAMRAKKFGQLGMDALYGGVNGQGTDGTFEGALANAAGGALGRTGARAGGLALRGIDTPSLSYLNKAEVPLTIGQIGRGSGTTFGDAMGGLEDRMAGLPGFDAIVNTARGRGEEGFNRAAFREAGGSGLTGSKGVVDLKQKVDGAYSFLDNTNLPLDAQFAGSQAMVRADLPNVPAFGPEVGKSMDMLDRASMGGSLPGREWQSAISDTRGNRSSIMGQPFAGNPQTGTGAVGALDRVEDNLLTLAERQGPSGAVDNLTSANTLNGQYQTLLSALDNGPTQARGEMFSPTRLDTASRNGARNFGGRAASMRGERPFYDLTQAGMEVMPNQVPDSGTAGRSLMYAGLYGAGLGGVGGAAAADEGEAAGGGAMGGASGAVLLPLALAALYSKGGQKGLQKALLAPRKKAVQRLGNLLANPNVVRGFGQLGSGAIRDLLFNPELEQ